MQPLPGAPTALDLPRNSPQAPGMPPTSLLRTLFVLGRISNLPTVWTNVLVGWCLAGGSYTGELAALLAGFSLVYVAGMTLNDACDARWDREHASQRPIPSGKISRGAVWTVGIVEMLAGLALLFLLTTAHPLLILGLVVMVILYDLVHKRWAGSVLLMGLCRALVYLGAGSAVASHTDAIDLPQKLHLIAGGAVLYIAGLTLVARGEHLERPPVMRRLHGLLLMVPVLFPLVASRGVDSSALLLFVAMGGIALIFRWIVRVRRAISERVPKGIALGLAGIALYDACAVVFADWRAALACLACFGLTLLWQRVIPAT